MDIPKEIKSHIVPQVYLKGFTNEVNKLWCLNIKGKYPSIKEVFTSQVCYELNGFRIKNENILKSFGTDDVDFIEKEVFVPFENNYLRILTDISNQKDQINIKDAELLIDTILNIKNRNKSIRKVYNKEKIKPVIENILGPLSEIFQKLMPEYDENLYFSTLVKIDEMKFVKEMLLNSGWLIIYPQEDWSFFTSDNPGFSFDKNFKVYNTLINGEFWLNFPLSSRYCLIISNKYKDETNTKIKHILFKSVPQSMINTVNEGTMFNCNSQIFSNKKEIVQSCLDKRNKK